MRIKNKTGSVASIGSLAGTWEIAADGIVDLLALDGDGVPINNSVDLLASPDLDAALRSGDWVVVDDNDAEIATAAVGPHLLAANQAIVDLRAAAYVDGTLNITDGVPLVVATWTLDANETLAVDAKLILFPQPSNGRQRGAIYKIIGMASRGAGSAELIAYSVIDADNVPGSRPVALAVSGNDVQLTLRLSITDAALPYALRYTTDQRTI